MEVPARLHSMGWRRGGKNSRQGKSFCQGTEVGELDVRRVKAQGAGRGGVRGERASLCAGKFALHPTVGGNHQSF